MLNKVQQAFTSNYEKLKDLQYIQQSQLSLHTQNLKWTIEDIPKPYHDMRRTADLVCDDSGDSLFLRKIDTQPCIIYKYKVLANDWQLCIQCPPSCYRFSMAYHNHLMIIGGAMSRDDKATRSGEIQSLVDGIS